MRRITRLFILLAASTFVYTAVPAHAQDVVPGMDAKAIEHLIRDVDSGRRLRAVNWAQERGIPLQIEQPDGGLAALIDVTPDGQPLYVTTLNKAAAEMTHTRSLHPGQELGLDLSGRGLKIGVWDAGRVFLAHQEFGGRIEFGDQSDNHNHATHVGGTLIAAGVREEARGMAYEAILRSYDWTNDATEMTNEAQKGLLVSNHSYGLIAGWHYGDLEGNGSEAWYWVGDPEISLAEDHSFGYYSSDAAQFDRVVYSNPYYLPVVAAGNDRGDRGPTTGVYRGLNDSGHWQNYSASTRPVPADGGEDGYDTIPGTATAKNILTIGSVGGTTLPNISRFSGNGPVDDGRIKPDIVGKGEQLFSTTLGGVMSYGSSSGTSMATPNVAGSLLLLQEYHMRLHGEPMRAASLKGLVIHTASDLGNPGPDYRYGWGLLDARAAAEQLTASLSNPIALLEEELVDGGTFSQLATVDEAGPLTVTISWTDPVGIPPLVRGAGSLDDPKAILRNDLDVRLIDNETGTVYRPYTLSASNPAAVAVPGDNVVDPVEQIYLPEASAGSFTIIVTHKNTLVGNAPQAFTLLVRGASESLRPVALGPISVDASVERVRLEWQTLFERQDGALIVERAPITLTAGQAKQVGAYATVGTVSIPGGSDTARPYTFTDTRLLTGQYKYRLLYAADGTPATAGLVVSEVEVNVPAPRSFVIVSNFPNPFTDRTEVVLDLPRAQQARIEVYDLLGRRLASLRDEQMAAGRHVFPVDASGWAAGVYFVRVETPNGITSHRMVVAR